MTREDYLAVVRQYASGVVTFLRRDEGHEIEDLVEDYCGDSGLVSSFANALAVLRWSDNRDAIDSDGDLAAAECIEDAVCRAAYYALRRDVTLTALDLEGNL